MDVLHQVNLLITFQFSLDPKLTEHRIQFIIILNLKDRIYFLARKILFVTGTIPTHDVGKSRTPRLTYIACTRGVSNGEI